MAYVDVSTSLQHRMRALGISSEMVAAALNAPDRVRHLPLSRERSYFCAFEERTIRVLATLDDCVVAVSWTTDCSTSHAQGDPTTVPDSKYPERVTIAGGANK